MNCYLSASPAVLSFLQDAHEKPEEEGSRLVLADFLEDHGDPDRAEFIRLQCRLAAGAPVLEKSLREQMAKRCGHILGHRGGGWLGPLWTWSTSPMDWHRGLLAVRMPRRCALDALVEILPWIDTALFVLHGKGGFERVADLLRRSVVNHLHLDFRVTMREDTILEMLGQIPESRCLRTLSFHWPLSLLRRPTDAGEEPATVAAVSERFLDALLGDLPLGRHLTHLGSSHPFAAEQNQVVRDFGVKPVHAQDSLWMHRQPATVFQAQSVVPSSLGPLSSS